VFSQLPASEQEPPLPPLPLPVPVPVPEDCGPGVGDTGAGENGGGVGGGGVGDGGWTLMFTDATCQAGEGSEVELLDTLK